ncbi:hypothetical protein [Mucilaginibacter gotjawali]|uniref:Uncharacterized protein n=1 Tax=Mucilaginibacter gotjawali TaxID=1550579 RepID=A0A839SFG8_9SPHI|nr:hypothetical protein [Mucilaginibacter gotjawali]MBB3057001.1 hypothetical protein [Mucilaginibacter gotjawali]
MKNLTFITILLLLSTIAAKAQEVKKAQPDSIIRVIPVGDPRHSSYLYTIGDKLRTSDEVAVRLMAYAPSATEYHAAKNNITWVYVSGAGFAVSGLAAVIEFANNNKNAGAASAIVNGQAAIVYQHHSLTGAYVFTGMATAFLVSSIINLSKAAFHSNKAIKLYNQRFE